MNLLVIDDDEKLCALLRRYLTDFGYRVTTALDPKQGLAQLEKAPPDLVILDVMMPGMTGFDVCREIRRTSSVPIIMLTARGDLMDRVVGLEMGADDYLPKPFEPRELVARIQSVLRRAAGVTADQPRQFGRLTIDFGGQTATLDTESVPLTTNEFAVLALLARHPGRVQSRDDILQVLRGMDSDPFNRTVDITVSRLRQKLTDDPKQPEFIKTVWGSGYAFIARETDNAS